jgi:hypothetical protein
MKNFSKITLSVLIVASATLTSCNKDDDAPAPPVVKASIYERLGGTKMVADPDNSGKMIEAGRLSFRKVVNTTIELIVADVKTSAAGNLSAHFAPLLAETGDTQATNSAKLSKNLTDFFSANTGGGKSNTYTGMDMVKTHDPAQNARMGTKVNTADYTKFEGYVGAAANANGVASNTELYTDVVAVLESLRAPIVQK